MRDESARLPCGTPEAPKGTRPAEGRDWEAHSDTPLHNTQRPLALPETVADNHPPPRGKSVVLARLRVGRVAECDCGEGAPDVLETVNRGRFPLNVSRSQRLALRKGGGGAHQATPPTPPAHRPPSGLRDQPPGAPCGAPGGWFYTWTVGEMQAELGEHAWCTNKNKKNTKTNPAELPDAAPAPALAPAPAQAEGNKEGQRERERERERPPQAP